MWAFGTSIEGLGRSDLDFWLLTPREYIALQREWERARGIKPPLTAEEKSNLEWGQHKIAEMWGKALDSLTPAQKANYQRMRGLPRATIPERVN